MITAIITGLIYAISSILYYCEVGLGKIIDFLYDIFQVFVGAKTITNGGDETYLIDIFFQDGIVSTLYWGMAVIGFAMTFGFAIISVIKKFFDSTGEKVKVSYGQILINSGKAILLIILMTAIVSATVTASGVLMDQITYLFDNAEEINDPSEIVFTDEQIGTMFHIIDTISNYGLNPGYDNRFNLNSCYNDVRQDLCQLAQSNVFNYTYAGCEDSWQYYLSQLYLASDPTQDIPIDVVNDSVSTAINNIIYEAKNSSTFKPLQRYNRGYSYNNYTDNFGKILMLAGSFGAANNSAYDGDDAGFKDQVRGPFYMGVKDIYSKSDVEDYFSIWIGDWRHITVLLCEIVMLMEFVKMIFNAVARIFNIILLYITAPPFIAVMPLDDGGKFKQWTTAFVIQTLSIFGSYISVRLITVFVPIIMSSSLVIFTNGFKNVIAKLLFILGICLTAQKASGMISGILSDNAASSALGAGNIGDTGLSMTGKAVGAAGKLGMKVGSKVLGGVASLGKMALGAAGGAVMKKVMSGNHSASSSVRQASVPAGAQKTGTKPDPNSTSNPIDSSTVKDHGQGNGTPVKSDPKNSFSNPKSEFQPGMFNSHFGEKTQGGFTLGGGPGGQKPVENLGGSKTNPKINNGTTSDFQDNAINSHYGQTSNGGFRLGQNVNNGKVNGSKTNQKTNQTVNSKTNPTTSTNANSTAGSKINPTTSTNANSTASKKINSKANKQFEPKETPTFKLGDRPIPKKKKFWSIF